MTEENRRENAKAEVLLGDDALRAAGTLVAAGLPNDAVSRAYYTAFHYARALLLTEGHEPKTHRGVLALMAQYFEGLGALPRDAVAALARLQSFRAIADYDARTRLAPERAAEEVDVARLFCEAARSLLIARGV